MLQFPSLLRSITPPLAGTLTCAFLAIATAEAASLAEEARGSGPVISVPNDLPSQRRGAQWEPNLIDQSQVAADRKSRGCVECHKNIEPMHASPNVVLGCIDCHGGNPTPGLTQRKAHVQPANPNFLAKLGKPE